MIAMKFGGTSVGSAQAIQRVAEIIRSRLPKNPVVIVSAVGGITDKLVNLAKTAGNGDSKKAKDILNEIYEKAVLFIFQSNS